jgi:protocatechuate 3,4-dioxygenase beta subunit
MKSTLVMIGLAIALATQAGIAQIRLIDASGVVSHTSGEPVADAAIALVTAAGTVPADERLRRPVPVDAAGRFQLTGIPSGQYRIVVATREALSTWPDASLVARLNARAFPFDFVTSGVVLNLTVDVGPPPDRAIVLSRVSFSRMEVMGGPGGTPGAPALPGRNPGPVSMGMNGPGVITGVVRDDSGMPLAGVAVQAGRWRRPTARASSQLMAIGLPVLTNSAGVYRLEGLPSATYAVGALEWHFDVRTLDQPSRRSVATREDADGSRTALRTTYFPGTRRAAQARDVVVDTGEVSGIDIQMQRSPVQTIRVRFSGSDNQPPRFALVRLTPRSEPDQFSDRNTVRGAAPPDGLVTFADVGEGEYTLTYYTPTGWVRAPLPVPATATAGDDVLEFRLNPPLEVSGTVDLRPTRLAGGPEALKGLTVALNLSPIQSGPVLRSPVGEDGRFTIRGVPGGPYVLTLAPGSGWIPVTSMVAGQDTLDAPVDVERTVSDARLTLTDRETTIQGRVTGGDGGPVNGAIVAVYATDERHWTPTGGRRVRVITVVPGGGFNLSGLPPGDYLAAAFPPGTRITNAVLRAKTGEALTFSLSVGETKSLPLILR